MAPEVLWLWGPEEGTRRPEPEGLLASEEVGEWSLASLNRTTLSFWITYTEIPDGLYRTQYAPVLDDLPRLHTRTAPPFPSQSTLVESQSTRVED